MIPTLNGHCGPAGCRYYPPHSKRICTIQCASVKTDGVLFGGRPCPLYRGTILWSVVTTWRWSRA